MINEYQEVINQFLNQNFKLTFDGKISINPKLTHIGARYVIDKNEIQISPRIINAPFVDKINFNKILYHEALHYALKKLGMPYSDGHPEFETYLSQFNLPTSDPNSNNYGHTKKAILCYEHGTAFICPNCHKLINAKIDYLNSYKIFNHHTCKDKLVEKESDKIPLIIKIYQ